MKPAIIQGKEFQAHEMGIHAPESPRRLLAISDHLIETGLIEELEEKKSSRKILKEDVLRVHSLEHWDFLKENSPKAGYFPIDPDTKMNSFTWETSLLAGGAVLDAVDRVMKGENNHVFCAVRPPGHHVEKDVAMGFCFFNSIAMATAYALEKHGLNRVCIVDFDVHHGNGTEDIFKGDPRVQILSCFQHPFYPGRPFLQNHDRVVNVPLDPGSGRAELETAFSGTWLPAFESFKPELVFISAGFDAHEADPLGQLEWIEDDYLWLSFELSKLAKRHSGDRIVSALEGGYDLQALAGSVAAHLRGLLSSS